MMYDLIGNYQLTAVSKIVTGIKELLYSGNQRTQMIFKSPTGSGKTIMMAKVLETLTDEKMDADIVYIWAATGELHKQSYNKLKYQYLPDSELNMILLEQMGADALAPNTVLFCNWASLFKTKKKQADDGTEIVDWDNVFVRIGENGRNLQEVLEKTRREHRKIVLIVDEAHQTYLGTNSQKLVNEVIQPDLTIEVSATPKITLPAGYYEKNIGRFIEVPLQDVIESGLIKNKTIINHNITGEITTASTDEIVISAALRQREILAQKYIENGSPILPLVLIQIPDTHKDASADENMRECVEEILKKHGITYDNQKLAIWLSDDKTNKSLVDRPDSPVQVLIFKQAIATGWDCPRAQILVMLRDIKSITFEIQTVGRILRMPELKHYTDDELNTAYVFTNIKEINIDNETDSQVFFRTYRAKLRDDIENITLLDNSYSTRQNRQRLMGSFKAILIKKLDEKFDIQIGDDNGVRYKKLDKYLQLYPEELTIPMLSNIVLDNLDNIDKSQWEQNTAKVKADAAYIGRAFNMLLRAWVAPYAPADSINTLRQALYKWFAENGFTDKLDVQRILTCSDETKPDGIQQILTPIINDAKKEYGHTNGEYRTFSTNVFHIPSDIEYGQGYCTRDCPKHALQPYYYNPKVISAPEMAFEQLLENCANVLWWYRNGVNEPKYFAVMYEFPNKDTSLSETRGFYPDYIVKFTDGRIGIFDTKSGIHATSKETDAKLNALHKYITEHNELNLFGGIIDVRDNNAMYLKDASDGEFTPIQWI
ncbi:MAG: DEAD/DEAH box helicase family protein [Muribaculaceae bacterium]|nr:DEAD/DEAH box helicase family protein [Muribaculaceae bacterium]